LLKTPYTKTSLHHTEHIHRNFTPTSPITMVSWMALQVQHQSTYLPFCYFRMQQLVVDGEPTKKKNTITDLLEL